MSLTGLLKTGWCRLGVQAGSSAIRQGLGSGTGSPNGGTSGLPMRWQLRWGHPPCTPRRQGCEAAFGRPLRLQGPSPASRLVESALRVAKLSRELAGRESRLA